MLEEVELLKKLEKGTSVRILSEYYGISSSTVYDLKKQKQVCFFILHETIKTLFESIYYCTVCTLLFLV